MQSASSQSNLRSDDFTEAYGSTCEGLLPGAVRTVGLSSHTYTWHVAIEASSVNCLCWGGRSSLQQALRQQLNFGGIPGIMRQGRRPTCSACEAHSVARAAGVLRWFGASEGPCKGASGNAAAAGNMCKHLDLPVECSHYASHDTHTHTYIHTYIDTYIHTRVEGNIGRHQVTMPYRQNPCTIGQQVLLLRPVGD